MDIRILNATGPDMKFEPSTQHSVCSYPINRDPYEDKLIEVKESSVSQAGQGIFAKRDILPGTVVAFYNGTRIPPDTEDDDDDKWENCAYKIFIENGENQLEEKRERMDIPESLRNINLYCATLAHKINHSFKPNCKFGRYHHPIFGTIPCVSTLQFIPMGSELFTYYNYPLDDCPQWYTDLWES